jgi:hypothetical protein
MFQYKLKIYKKKTYQYKLNTTSLLAKLDNISLEHHISVVTNNIQQFTTYLYFVRVQFLYKELGVYVYEY